jgi:hypothetical protein
MSIAQYGFAFSPGVILYSKLKRSSRSHGTEAQMPDRRHPPGNGLCRGGTPAGMIHWRQDGKDLFT